VTSDATAKDNEVAEWFLSRDEERIIYLALTMAVMAEDTLLADDQLETAEALQKEFGS